MAIFAKHFLNTISEEAKGGGGKNGFKVEILREGRRRGYSEYGEGGAKTVLPSTSFAKVGIFGRMEEWKGIESGYSECGEGGARRVLPSTSFTQSLKKRKGKEE